MKRSFSSMAVAALALAVSATVANAGFVTFSITADNTAPNIGDTVHITLMGQTDGIAAGAYNNIKLGIGSVLADLLYTNNGVLSYVEGTDLYDNAPATFGNNQPAGSGANGQVLAILSAGNPASGNINSTTIPAAQKVGLAPAAAVVLWEGDFTAVGAGSTSLNVQASVPGSIKDYFAKPPVPATTVNRMQVGYVEDTYQTISDTITVSGVALINEFVVGAGTHDYTGLQTTVDLATAPNHANPNYTPELPIDAGKQAKGQIVITGLDPLADRNVLLLWSTAGLTDMPGVVQPVEAQWAAFYPGAVGQLALPVGAAAYTLSYDFTNGNTNTLTNFAVVPEPASLGLLALGALGLLGKRRTK